MNLYKETDYELKARRFLSFAKGSIGYLDSIISEIISLNGVTECRVYENTSSVTDSDGIPPHSIWTIVNGGADYENNDYTAIFNILKAIKPNNNTEDFDNLEKVILPDLRGRVTGSKGQGVGLTSRENGDAVGEEMHQLTEDEMPSHSRPKSNFTINNDGSANGGNGYPMFDSDSNTIKDNYDFTSAQVNDQPHNNIQPTTFLGIYFIYTGVETTKIDTTQQGFQEADTSAADNYILTNLNGENAIEGYVKFKLYSFIVVNSNTGASNININNRGLRQIKKANGINDLDVGDLMAGNIAMLQYEGTYMRFMGNQILYHPEAKEAKVETAGIQKADPNFIAGFIPNSNVTNSATFINITKGRAIAKDGETWLELASNLDNLNIQTLAGGSLTADTTYHLFYYLKEDGTQTFGVSETLENPTLDELNGSAYRRVFSFITNGSGELIEFVNNLTNDNESELIF